MKKLYQCAFFMASIAVFPSMFHAAAVDLIDYRPESAKSDKGKLNEAYLNMLIENMLADEDGVTLSDVVSDPKSYRAYLIQAAQKSIDDGNLSAVKIIFPYFLKPTERNFVIITYQPDIRGNRNLQTHKVDALAYAKFIFEQKLKLTPGQQRVIQYLQSFSTN